MTLDEAIKHCEEKSCSGSICSEEHKQLGEWLKELKQYRNIWKDNTEYPSEKDEDGDLLPIVACCSEYEDVICGDCYIINEGSEYEDYKIGDFSWEIVKKWAYLKDLFPYRCYFDDVNDPVLFNETRNEGDGMSNRALESHKAWEESLLYADRIRGSF